MPYSVLENKMRALPSSALPEVAVFLDYMLFKVHFTETKTVTEYVKGGFGCMKDIPCRMSADFDNPMEDFKDYM